MANIKFVEAPAASDKGFRIGGHMSLFRNGVTFTVTGYKFGNYMIDGAQSEHAATSQAILLTTSIGEDLALNRLIKGRRVVYDNEGHAHIINYANFGSELMAYLLKLGRRADNEDLLVGSVEDVAKHAITYFNGKTIAVKEETFFAKDKEGRLVPGSPTVQFSFQ